MYYMSKLKNEGCIDLASIIKYNYSNIGFWRRDKYEV